MLSLFSEYVNHLSDRFWIFGSALGCERPARSQGSWGRYATVSLFLAKCLLCRHPEAAGNRRAVEDFARKVIGHPIKLAPYSGIRGQVVMYDEAQLEAFAPAVELSALRPVVKEAGVWPRNASGVRPRLPPRRGTRQRGCLTRAREYNPFIRS